MFKAIPRVQTDNREVNQLQSNIISALNPVLSNQMLNGRVITEVELSVGDNTINHGLGQTLQGWSIVRKRASADIYDKQDSNPNPALTLILYSSVATKIDLYVF